MIPLIIPMSGLSSLLVSSKWVRLHAGNMLETLVVCATRLPVCCCDGGMAMSTWALLTKDSHASTHHTPHVRALESVVSK